MLFVLHHVLLVIGRIALIVDCLQLLFENKLDELERIALIVDCR